MRRPDLAIFLIGAVAVELTGIRLVLFRPRWDPEWTVRFQEPVAVCAPEEADGTWSETEPESEPEEDEVYARGEPPEAPTPHVSVDAWRGRGYERVCVRFADGGSAVGVEFVDMAGVVLARTDDAGEARVHGLARAVLTGRVSLHGDGGVLRAGAGYRSGADRFDLVLWSGVRAIRGRVVDGNRAPRAGVRLSLLAQDLGANRLEVVTDAAGAFVLEGASPGAFAVRCEDDEWLAYPHPAAIAASATDADVELVVHPARQVRVVTEGIACTEPRARVTVHYRDPVSSAAREDRCWMSGPGTFVARVPPDQDLCVLARLADTPIAAPLICVAGWYPEEVRLRPRAWRGDSDAWIPIRCVAADTGIPVEPSVVLVRPRARGWERTRHASHADAIYLARGVARAISAGTLAPPTPAGDCHLWAIGDLEPGWHDLYLWVRGYAPVALPGEATSDGVFPAVEARFKPLDSTLSVHVVSSATRAPARSGVIEITPAPGQRYLHPLLGLTSSGTSGLPHDVPLVDGCVSVPLPLGVYDIRIRVGGHDPVVTRVRVPGPSRTLIVQPSESVPPPEPTDE